jgi:type VI secretion system secreted protein Hcp
VRGSGTQTGREGKITLIAASHGIQFPRDPQTGLPSGSRLHNPLIITKQSGKSSRLLYGMLASNENSAEWELLFLCPLLSATSSTGQEVQSHAVKLLNACFASINFWMSNSKNPALVRYEEYEQVAFTNQKMIWTSSEGGLTAAHDWSSPVL